MKSGRATLMTVAVALLTVSFYAQASIASIYLGQKAVAMIKNHLKEGL